MRTNCRFQRNGYENDKSAWLFQRRTAGARITYASIVWDGADWVVRARSGRIDRFEHLSEAKNEALKL